MSDKFVRHLIVFISVVVGLLIVFFFWNLGLYSTLGLPYLSVILPVAPAIFGMKAFERYQRNVGIIFSVITLGCLVYGIWIINNKDSKSGDNFYVVVDNFNIDENSRGNDTVEGDKIKDEDEKENGQVKNDKIIVFGNYYKNDTLIIDDFNINEIEFDNESDSEEYFPILDMEEYRYIFIAIFEEPSNTEDTNVNIENILRAISQKDMEDIEKIKNIIKSRFENSSQTIQNYSIEKVNKNKKMGKL